MRPAPRPQIEPVTAHVHGRNLMIAFRAIHITGSNIPPHSLTSSEPPPSPLNAPPDDVTHIHPPTHPPHTSSHRPPRAPARDHSPRRGDDRRGQEGADGRGARQGCRAVPGAGAHLPRDRAELQVHHRARAERQERHRREEPDAG